MTHKKQLLPALALLFLPLFLSISPSAFLPLERGFVIESDSELSIRGSSNVNQFSCLCLCIEKNRSHRVNFQPLSGKAAFEFSHTSLQLATADLDCGHKGINKDLYQTLQADQHPNITIELLKAAPAKGVLVSNDGWMPIQATTAITIAGVRKVVPMTIRARQLSDNEFHFVGSKDLLMTDFNIEPPKALFGLIKVDNTITINLDLSIRLTEA